MPTIEGIIKTLNNMVPELDVTHHEVVKNTVKLQPEKNQQFILLFWQ